MTGRVRIGACAAFAVAMSAMSPASALAATSGTVDPNPVTFTNVRIGTTASVQLTITNTGDAKRDRRVER